MTPSRKTDPISIPAVPPCACDAAFFARLRMIDDTTYLRAVTMSAARGQVLEVVQALQALRSDQYEPLAYEDLKTSITLQGHPLLTTQSNDFSQLFTHVDNIWDAVALALTSPEISWNAHLNSTRSSFISQEPSVFEASRHTLNDQLLAQAIELCARQANRTPNDNGEGSILGLMVTQGSDGMTAWYGPRPWMQLLDAVSTYGSNPAHINRVIDSIPVAALKENVLDFEGAIENLAAHCQPASALRLLQRHSVVNFRSALTYATGNRFYKADAEKADVFRKLATGLVSGTDAAKHAQAGQALLDFIDHVVADSPNKQALLINALVLTLPSLGELEYKNKSYSDKYGQPLALPGSPSEARQAIDGLIARIDASFGVTPGQAWPSQAESGGAIDISRSMTQLLAHALDALHPALVERLSEHWRDHPEGVNPHRMGRTFRRVAELDESLINAVRCVVQTMQRIGFDVDGALGGKDPLSSYSDKADKPAMLLHGLAKASKEVPGQIELLSSLVAAGLNPDLKDARGWKARVFIGDDDKPEWDALVLNWFRHQKARDAVQEIVSGVPAPKRRAPRKAPEK